MAEIAMMIFIKKFLLYISYIGTSLISADKVLNGKIKQAVRASDQLYEIIIWMLIIFWAINIIWFIIDKRIEVKERYLEMNRKKNIFNLHNYSKNVDKYNEVSRKISK